MHKEISYNISEQTGCWECTSHKPDSHGYGVVRVNGRRIKVHRYAYERHKGKIPEGYLVRHSCDNRICVNPDHLLIGKEVDNSEDMIVRGRHLRKLTAMQVSEIRTRYKQGGVSYADLANAYEISKAMIYNIIKFKKHIKTITAQ